MRSAVRDVPERLFTTFPGSKRVRTIWGEVGYSGVVSIPGSGDWIVTRTGVGRYTIAFVTPFSTLPVIILTVYNGNPVISEASIMSRNPQNCQIYTFQSGASADQYFDFQATGLVENR